MKLTPHHKNVLRAIRPSEHAERALDRALAAILSAQRYGFAEVDAVRALAECILIGPLSKGE